MNEYPDVWYYLLTLVSILGVLTWIMDKFSERDNIKRISGILGSLCMLGLVYVTLTMDGA